MRHPGDIQEIFRRFSAVLNGTERFQMAPNPANCYPNIQVTFTLHSRYFHDTFRQHSGTSQTSRNISKHSIDIHYTFIFHS